MNTLNPPPRETPPPAAAGPPPATESESWLYIPALLLVVLIVAIALLLPCMVALQTHRLAALIATLFFFPLPVAAYAYLWRFGYLQWAGSAPIRK